MIYFDDLFGIESLGHFSFPSSQDQKGAFIYIRALEGRDSDVHGRRESLGKMIKRKENYKEADLRSGRQGER